MRFNKHSVNFLSKTWFLLLFVWESVETKVLDSWKNRGGVYIAKRRRFLCRQCYSKTSETYAENVPRHGNVYGGGSFVITNMKIRVNKGLKTRSDRTKREVTVGIRCTRVKTRGVVEKTVGRFVWGVCHGRFLGLAKWPHGSPESKERTCALLVAKIYEREIFFYMIRN